MIDYKALAGRVKCLADYTESDPAWDAAETADLRTVVSLLEGMADAPEGFALVPKMPSNEVWQEAESAFHRAGAETFRRPGDVRAIWRDQISAAFRVFASTAPHPAPHPAPQRQPEPRPCTCHPDDNPPVPCAQKYALSECRAVSGEPTEAQIEYEILCNDEWVASASGPGAEAEILRYLTHYEQDGPCEVYTVTRRLVDRAALAAKEEG